MIPRNEFIQKKIKQENRFDFFFTQDIYLLLKKYFYNYRARSRAIIAQVKMIRNLAWLEVGAGVTPVLQADFNVTYTDLSPHAVQELNKLYPHKNSVVCSALAIPFPSHSFDGVVCSEVLEHIQNDTEAIAEMSRVLKPGGKILITVPANPWMYSFEDAYVAHCRRYRVEDLARLIEMNGMENIQFKKVSGLIDKLCLMAAVAGFRIYSRVRPSPSPSKIKEVIVLILLPIYIFINLCLTILVQLEAAIVPMSCCSVILISAQKVKSEIKSST